jgi:hypothetical protein
MSLAIIAAMFASCKPASAGPSKKVVNAVKPTLESVIKPNQPKEVRAMWLSFPFWDMTNAKKELFARYIASQGVNKVFLSVYDSGIARWNSAVLTQNGIATTTGDLPLIFAVNLFRKYGIEVSAFFEGGLSVFLERDFVKQHQELLQRCPNGTVSGEHGGHLYSFLDPSSPQVQSIIISALEELARHSVGFQEIQLDRFRYTHFDWKFCTAADGTSNPQYVNNIVQQSYRRIKTVNPSALVTAAPVGSYGYWKHNQSWGEWVAGGYIDGIESQAYIPHQPLTECARGTAQTKGRKITLAVFKGELASLTGQPRLLETSLSELNSLGANANKIMEVEYRRPMVLAREKELAAAKKPFRLSIGFYAQDFDDSECVQEQMKLARELGYKNSVLWVSQVAPSNAGEPNPAIDDNLSLLRSTFWKD